MIGFIISVWLLIQTAPVQNLLVRQVTHILSSDLGTPVTIRHVNFALFNSMLLEGTLIKDQKNDTLLYAGLVRLNITDWFFFKEKIELKYIRLEDAYINLNRSDSIWNYRFIADYFSGPPSPASQKKNIDLNIRTLDLKNIRIVQRDEWRGEDLTAVIGSLNVDAESFDINSRVIRLRSVNLVKPSFSIFNYDGKRIRPPAADDEEEETFVNDPQRLRWNTGEWDITIHFLDIADGVFRTDVQDGRTPYPYFDGQHILFSAITASFKDCRLVRDSILASISLSAKERSGIQVKQLFAQVKMHPEAMEFSQLDLRTNRSRLHDFFAMRYSTFDNMQDFISKVRMEGHFDNAIVHSDDIAYFAPELQHWKKSIQIKGTVNGSVDNLKGRDLAVQAGNDTYLKGNLSLAGLPYIHKTYIDFEAENFATNYADAITIVPQIKNIRQPRLDVLEYLKFRGNFTGFFSDFVTYGSLETKLGTVTTDLNMKLPDNQPALYSGSIKSNGFVLGPLIGNQSLGKMVFQGNVNGKGLDVSNINAALDGNIDLLEFNSYPYRHITVKGDVSKRLFNGELISADSNLLATLNGLIDFSQDIPEFNFDAVVAHADLKKMNLLRDSLEFEGKFHINFKGNNIDNFLGTARIYEASLFKNSKRISFDSLYIESKILDSNKVITAVSNEFDAVLAGEFSILDLPAAFQTFLNRYYPAYVNPSKKKLNNENFSFVITTKNVEDYINLITPQLSGFNYSALTGRINTRGNLLDLNTEIPQFTYKNVSFYDFNLKAAGDIDSLTIQNNISNIYINDSLHFPSTIIRISSANDNSIVDITTSANQTLSSANIAAKVQTLPRGARIRFLESFFDLNGKSWHIDKDGALEITEDHILANAINIHNGLQEIRISSSPSAVPNSHDLLIDLKKINIGDFTPYIVKSNRIEGLLTGSVRIIDPFGKLLIDADANAELFRLDNDSIGKLNLNAYYDRENRQVNFKAVSENELYDFILAGLYQQADSVRQENLDMTATLEDTRINLLEQYLSGVFSDVSGLATGSLRIVGPPDDLDYIGKIRLKNGALRVKFTNVLYKIPEANVSLLNDRIDFGVINALDEHNNKAVITKSLLYHRGFDSLSFDFTMHSNKIQVLSTSSAGGDPYYGNVVAQANMSFKGPLDNMQMNIEAVPADSSSLFINMKSGKESGMADFIEWKVYGKEMQSARKSAESNLSVNLDVTANNYANVYVILDELTGDIIQATGRGNLKMHAATDGSFTIAGRYDIDRGNYNFNFESLLKKPFKLREDVGNYIQWTGDPNDATINIEAEYEAENVRFSDLDIEALSALMSINNDIRRYRGKVLVVANLTEQLSSPAIKFQIELPQNSPMKNDHDLQFLLTRIQKDENELNKQVAFLLVFNSFGPISTSTNQSGLANSAFEGIVVGSISGVLSNTLSKQFSNVFQRVFNDKSIQVNFNAQWYSGTNFIENLNRNPFTIDRTNLNLSVGKSLFNERITFTFGSAMDFGLSAAQVNASKNLPFLPDINAEWKITPDGKLSLNFFYRDSYSFLSGASGRQNRSGASISYRREFDKIEDLKRNKKEEDR